MLELGTSYYPDYAESHLFSRDQLVLKCGLTERLEEDFQKMKESEIDVVRMGEFSWSTVEKAPDEYTPEIFLEALDLAQKYELKVIFCTPTATPPKWLIDMDPSILPVSEDGSRQAFGSRRHYDPCSPSYKKHTRRIVEYYAKTFGGHESIVLWQIDNEFGHHGSWFLATDAANESFRDFLRTKYEQDIELLNRQWFTCFWSQGYRSFDEIECPKPTLADKNSHLLLDHRRFCTAVFSEYQKMQMDTVRKTHPDAKFTHNLISNFYDLCPWRMTENLDVVGFDHYQDFDYPDPIRSTSNFTLMRGLATQSGTKTFKVIEQQPVKVNWQEINRRFDYDWLLLWAGQALTNGCDLFSYFSWQKFYGGSEQYHDAILAHDIRQKVSPQQKMLKATRQFVTTLANDFGWKSPPEISKDVLILCDTESLWTHRINSQSTHYDTTYQLDDLTKILTGIGKGFHITGKLDSTQLREYKTLILPGHAFMLTDKEAELVESFIHDGGTLVTMPRSLIKERTNHMNPLPFSLGSSSDVVLEDYGALGPEESESVELAGGYILKGYRWAEQFNITNEGYIVRATFSSGHYKGSPAVFEKQLKHGRHIHFSFCPVPDKNCEDFFMELFEGHEKLTADSLHNCQIFPLQGGKSIIINFDDRAQQVFAKKDVQRSISFSMSETLDLMVHRNDGNSSDSQALPVWLPQRSITIIT